MLPVPIKTGGYAVHFLNLDVGFLFGMLGGETWKFRGFVGVVRRMGTAPYKNPAVGGGPGSGALSLLALL